MGKQLADRIVGANQGLADDLVRFVLTAGMEFHSPWQWWGEGRKRLRPHEGVDFCSYLTRQGRVKNLPAGTLVPALSGGTVVAVTDDFIAKSVWLQHAARVGNDFLYSVCGHLAPAASLGAGAQVQDGEILGVIAEGAHQSLVPSHLHLSLFMSSDAVPSMFLNWNRIGELPAIRFVDPFSSHWLVPNDCEAVSS